MSAGGIRIQIAADEPQLQDAALQFRGAVGGSGAGRLGQLANSDEIIRIQRPDAMNQVIAGLRPAPAGRRVADVMCHGGGPRREYGQISAAGTLQLELGALQALANLIVADRRPCRQRNVDAVLETGNLRVAKFLQRTRRGGVVTVTIDDHIASGLAPNSCRSLQYMRVGLSTRMRRCSPASGQISS